MAIDLDNLKSSINDYEQRVSKLLEIFNWTEANTLKESCNHQLINSTQTIKENDDENDPEYPSSLADKNYIKFDDNSLNQILNIDNKNLNCIQKLPDKFSDYQVNLNREQKLAVYNYVIEKTGKLTEPELVVIANKEKDESTNSPNDKFKKMTFAEIVAFRRDLKRRRLKYRIANTSEPTTVTEEFRNLIEIQMQALTQYNEKYNLPSTTSTKSSKDQQMLDRLDSSKITVNKYHKIRDRDRSHKQSKHQHKKSSKKHKKDRSRSKSPSYKSSKHKKHKKHHKHKRQSSSNTS